MKRIVSTIVGLAVAATMVHAAADEVYSVNVVGYVKKAVEPGKFYMLGMNFDTMQGNNTLKDIFGTDSLAQSDFWASLDKVIIWDPQSSTYQTYGQWTDGEFYLANDQSQFNSAIASNPVVEVGQAFWLSIAATTPAKETTLAGEVRAFETNSMNLVSGFQMVSYPFSSDVALQDTDFVNDGAASSDFWAACDKVIAWDSTTSSYQTYAPWTDGNWYLANDQAQFNSAIPATNTISLGDGVWYQAINGYTWTEGNPYLGNL